MKITINDYNVDENAMTNLDFNEFLDDVEIDE